MKILKVELQNINSLRCETPIVIDFEGDRFKDVGLFAITGATGAGKTTILDAITIALYRKVARFSNSSSKAGLSDVVSYGANGAMCRVVFETKDERYESQWEIRLTSGSGKLLANPRETVYLKNLSSGNILAESKTKCEEEIERITQLSYEQFLRSVLLAQGEFAAFLSAPAREKGNLLQQIAGDEIYKKIGEALSNRIGEEKLELDRIKNKINTDDLLSEETKKELQKEGVDLALKIQLLTNELTTVENILNWFAKKEEIILKQAQLEKDKTALSYQLEANRNKLNLLNLHESAEPFKELLEENMRLEREIARKQNRLAEIDIEYKTIDQQLKQTEEQALTVKKSLDEFSGVFKEWEPRLDEVNKLDVELQGTAKLIADKQKDVEEIEKAIGQLTVSTGKKTEEQKQKQTEILKTEEYLLENNSIPKTEKLVSSWNSSLTLRKSNSEQLSNLTAEINTNELERTTFTANLGNSEGLFKVENDRLEQLVAEVKDIESLLAGNDLNTLLASNTTLETKKAQLSELQHLSEKYGEILIDETTLDTAKITFEQQAKEVLAACEAVEKEIVVAIESLGDAERIYELESRISSFDEERKKLEKGKPCSLCGSTEHPYVEQYATLEISKSKKTVEERREKLEILKAKKVQADIQLAGIKIKLENCIEMTAVNQRLKAEVCTKFAGYSTEFKIEEILSLQTAIQKNEKEQVKVLNRISDTQKLLKAKAAKDVEIKTLQNKAKALEVEIATLKQKINSTDQLILKNKEELQTLNAKKNILETALLSEFDAFKLMLPPVEETNLFIRKIENDINLFNTKSKELVEVQHVLQELIIEKVNIDHQLKEKKDSRQFNENEINRQKECYLQIYEKRNAILPVDITTESKRKLLQKAIDQSSQDLDAITRELTTITKVKATLLGEKDNIDKEHVENQKALVKATGDLLERLEQSNFNSRDEVANALLSANDKKVFQMLKKQLDEKILELKTLDAGLNEDLEKLESGHTFDTTNEQAIMLKTNINEQKDASQHRIGEIGNKLQSDEAIRNRNQGVVDEIHKQDEVLRKWQGLMFLLGGSKDAFNTYVQRLTLNNLINLANIHLYKLNRRYSLELNKTYVKGEELNFMLVDHYQTGETRLVDTSSGGEKFLISLSLALGLSDLASRNVSIGSLYIDEGFGTLDSNTLETVISTLETLQAQGKMIGIISHVDNLKERIPVQIQVLKRSNGVSVVEIN